MQHRDGGGRRSRRNRSRQAAKPEVAAEGEGDAQPAQPAARAESSHAAIPTKHSKQQVQEPLDEWSGFRELLEVGAAEAADSAQLPPDEVEANAEAQRDELVVLRAVYEHELQLVPSGAEKSPAEVVELRLAVEPHSAAAATLLELPR